MKVLKGKKILVTGVGRKEGIGYAICDLCAQNGGDVFYTYWNAYDKKEGSLDNAEKFADEFKRHGINSYGLEADLSDESSVKKVFKEAHSALGEIDILINNACVSTRLPFDKISSVLLDEHYAVNMRAPFLLCLEFASHFSKNTGGKIINMTSGQSLGPMPQELAYTITKAGMEMLALQLSFELREKGITINAFDPGPTDTGWITPSVRKEIEGDPHPMEIKSAREVAKILFSFIQGEREGITGSVLHAQNLPPQP